MTIEQLIRARKAVVGVIGLGYVGLPLVRLFALQGFRVLGFDIDPAKIEKLRRGESYIKSVPDAAGSSSGSTRRPLHPARGGRDHHLRPRRSTRTAAPTPSSGDRRSIGKNLRKGQLVVLESTTYPARRARS
jgi:UDP-N-acetyl-D-mannosaminuronate dehydrogenase